jgi:hypothetical protein
MALTPSPCAITASPAAAILCAAFKSLSWALPQDGQTHSRIFSGKAETTCPQVEHIFEDGNQRSTRTVRLPYRSAFSSSIRIVMPMAASLKLRARLWFLTMPRRFRSSIQITSNSVTSRVESFSSASLRQLPIFSC